MLNIGFRAHDFGKFSSFEELGARIEEVEKESRIQLAIGKVIPDAKPWQEWDEEYIASNMEILKKHGVSISIVGCYINPVNPDPEKRKMEVERFKKSLSLTKAFGCKLVATETGTQNPKGGYHVTNSDPKFIEVFYESLSEMVEAAVKYDAYCVIEAVNRSHTISSAARMARMLEKFPSENLKVLYDPINLVPYTGIPEADGVAIMNPTPEACAAYYKPILDLYGDKLCAIHCKDYKLSDEGTKIGNITALTGVFDWRGFMGEVKKRGIDVPWSLENMNPATLKETLTTLRQMWEEV